MIRPARPLDRMPPSASAAVQAREQALISIRSRRTAPTISLLNGGFLNAICRLLASTIAACPLEQVARLGYRRVGETRPDNSHRPIVTRVRLRMRESNRACHRIEVDPGFDARSYVRRRRWTAVVAAERKTEIGKRRVSAQYQTKHHRWPVRCLAASVKPGVVIWVIESANAGNLNLPMRFVGWARSRHPDALLARYGRFGPTTLWAIDGHRQPFPAGDLDV